MLKVLMWAEEESFRAGSVLYNFKKRQCKKKGSAKKGSARKAVLGLRKVGGFQCSNARKPSTFSHLYTNNKRVYIRV